MGTFPISGLDPILTVNSFCRIDPRVCFLKHDQKSGKSDNNIHTQPELEYTVVLVHSTYLHNMYVVILQQCVIFFFSILSLFIWYEHETNIISSNYISDASHFNPPPQCGNNYYSMYPNILGHLSGKLSKKPHYSTAANTKKKSKTAILYKSQQS